jgi:glutamate formiminotransferase
VAPTLLAVPNVSEGRDPATLEAIGGAFETGGARLLDLHTDADHHRSVFTLAGEPGILHRALVAGARVAVERIDLRTHVGVHPRVGAVDVAPVVHLEDADRGAACAEALLLADRLGDELEIPVYLYGALAGGRTRAELRRGGVERVAPDYGPPRLHPTAGATLVAARPPLVAFNVQLAPPATVEQARAIAAAIREGGPEGLPGVRALGLHLVSRDVVQISTNIEDHRATTAAEVVEAVRRHAPVAGAELVALAPRAALAGFPSDVPLAGAGNVIETALRRGDAAPSGR